jgi:hypothetical protein
MKSTWRARVPLCQGSESSGAGLMEETRIVTMMMIIIILLLFFQKQNLASAVYLFGLGTRLSGPGLKHIEAKETYYRGKRDLL